jgi:hypothetical protein
MFCKGTYWEIGVNSILRLLQLVDFGDIADISEVRAASIFRAEVCRLVIFFVYKSQRSVLKRNGVRKIIMDWCLV